MRNELVRNNPFTKYHAFRAAAWVSLIINIMLIMGVLYNDSTDPDPILTIKEHGLYYGLFFLLQFACNLLLFSLLFLFCFRLAKKTRKSRNATLKAITVTILVCLLLSPLLSRLQLYIFEDIKEIGLARFTLFNLVKDLIAGIVVMLLTETISQGYKREQATILNQQLVAENIKVKYEALKNQLDPHFLFNSLNTLNGLIGLDEEKAHDYVDNLSSVFRYTLHSKNIVKLEDEIEFTDAYISLLRIRFGESMRVKYEIDARYRAYFILPVSIQLLIENAVKHNIIHKKNPLLIRIGTDDKANLIVSNHINLRPEESVGGIGLVNLAERYKILFSKEIEIKKANDVFSVSIPLLGEIDNELHI